MRKQHLLLTILLLFVFSFASIAQETAKKKNTNKLDNTLFGSIQQTVPAISFERRFIKTSKFFFVGSVGLMGEFQEGGDIAPGFLAEFGLVMGRKTNYIESGLKYYKINPQDPQGKERSRGFQGAFMGYRLVLPSKYKISFRAGISIGAAFVHTEDEIRHEFSQNEFYMGLGYRF